MNKRGQGALEYLLLIGGAILVAVVVITVLSGIGQSSGKETELSVARGICLSRPVGNCGGTESVTVGVCILGCVEPAPGGTQCRPDPTC